jgi:hypothetical protein
VCVTRIFPQRSPTPFSSSKNIHATPRISLTLWNIYVTDAPLRVIGLSRRLLTSSIIHDSAAFFSSPSSSSFLGCSPSRLLAHSCIYLLWLWILLSNTYTARTAIHRRAVCARARARIARRRTEKRGFSFWRFLAFTWQQSEIGVSIGTHR